MQNTSVYYGWNKDLPVSLLEKIRSDLKTAMLKKDLEVRDAIRLIMAEFPGLTVPITLESGKKSFRLKKPEEITDEDILDILRKLAKSEKTVLEIRKQETSAFLQVIESYLPRMAGRQEILDWITENIDMSDFRSPMQAMGPIMKHFGKQADGRLVKEILQQLQEKQDR